MDINRVRKAGGPTYGVQSVRSSGGKSAGSFQQDLGNQLKDRYRARITALFEELSKDADSIIDHVDISKFERYRRDISDLLSEVVKNAYDLHSERVMDFSGRQRVYASIRVIDKKLAELAEDLISRNSERILFLSRVDEIRGLVTDLLF